MPPELAAWLAGLSLGQHGAKLVSDHGVLLVTDCAVLDTADLAQSGLKKARACPRTSADIRDVPGYARAAGLGPPKQWLHRGARAPPLPARWLQGEAARFMDAAAAAKAKASQGSSSGGSSGGSGGSASKGAAAPVAVPALAPEELPLGRRLGGGSFGDVHEAAWRGTPVAVKLIRAGDEGLTAEARAARRLQRAPRRPAAARQQAAR